MLLERRGRKAGQLIGRSPAMQSVHAAAPESCLGRVVDLEIVAGGPNSLRGCMIGAIGEPSLSRGVPAEAQP